MALPDTYVETFHGNPEGHPYVKALKYRELGKTGMRLSNVSFGGGFLGLHYGEYDRKEAILAIQESIKSGINYIDTAPWYGASEEVLGEALSSVPREAYYIGTKVGRNYTPGWEGRFDFSAEGVLKSFDSSLAKLRLPYVDIIQVHDVEFALDVNQIINETLPALESVVKAGKARFIGVTGYNIEVLKTIAEQSRLDSVLSYCRYNLHDVSLKDYLPFFESKGIGIINASPVAMGLLTNAGPPAWHPASDSVKATARKAVDVARAKGKKLEEISLSYSLHPKEKSIATTLVSIPTRAILKENLQLATTPASATEEALQQGIRNVFGNQNNHWEGVEVAEYRKAIGK